jgi:hypothetical protein
LGAEVDGRGVDEDLLVCPMFENAARWAYGELCSSVPQLAYVELDNDTIGVRTRYLGASCSDSSVGDEAVRG